jgi:eukaryotic-like serine/threonine-protein kinase
MASETMLNGRYRLVSQQGAGGMAVIYKAVDTVLGRTVAVKVLRPSLNKDMAFIDRFRSEARSVANLIHPNIVTVHDFNSDNGAYYIVMEFVEGQDLKQVIRTMGALPIERALHYAIQICGGIGYAHRAGLVHADIKPQNVLLTKEDGVKVTDFGIAQVFSDTHAGERQDVVWGSPHYFAPEQARGEKPTPASDVYAIGIVLFEMLTGRLPYTGANQQELALAHIRDRIPLVSELNPSVPEPLVRIVEKVMSKEPDQRYRMADQLGHILTSYRDRGRQETMAAPVSNVPPPPPPTQPRAPQQYVPPPNSLPTMPASQRPANQAGLTQPSVPPADQTMRYSPAPHAPGQPPYNQQNAYPQQNYQQGGQPLYTPQNYQTTPMPPNSDSGYYTPSLRGEQEELPPLFDGVTLALAALAALAVMCLIPLWIAVLAARG